MYQQCIIHEIVQNISKCSLLHHLCHKSSPCPFLPSASMALSTALLITLYNLSGSTQGPQASVTWPLWSTRYFQKFQLVSLPDFSAMWGKKRKRKSAIHVSLKLQSYLRKYILIYFQIDNITARWVWRTKRFG